MPGIFITYRRSDSIAWAGRLHDSLKQHFSGTAIFMDIEAIPPGTKFSEYIRDAVGSCNILFVLIGPNWLAAVDEEGERRLDDEEDFVALEIEAALDRDVPIIPTLVGDALMPRKQDLPEHLRPLCDFQNFVISDRSWHDDCARLAKHIQGIVEEQPVKPGSGKMLKVAVGGVIGIALILTVVYFFNQYLMKPPTVERETKPPVATSPPTVKSPETKPETPVRPTVEKPETSVPPTVEKPDTSVPAAHSLLDVGLEGRWEMVELLNNGKRQKQQFTVEITRVGNNLEIIFKPSGIKMMLTNKPDQMRLTTQDEQVIIDAKRYTSDQEGNWRVSAFEMDKNSKTEKPVLDGRIKVSEDWHRFEGFVITKKENARIDIGMTIDKFGKKCKVTWGRADKSIMLVAQFHKI